MEHCGLITVRLFLYLLFISPIVAESISEDSTYENIKTLRESLFTPDRYNKELRPLQNQSKTIKIEGFFNFMAIVSVDDVNQEMVTRGFFVLFWHDERVKWNSSAFGGRSKMHVQNHVPWLPYIHIVNSVGDDDPLINPYSYTEIDSTGIVTWMPGGTFHTSCNLNLQKFPFDVQNCEIRLSQLYYDDDKSEYALEETVDQAFQFSNSGWEILQLKLTNGREIITPFGNRNNYFACPTVHIRMKRRPITIVMNVILPIMLLSLLNNLVFLFPPNTGQNIGYAITVLLSMVVFLGTVSSMTPQVSNVIPALTSYLFILLLTSVITVSVVISTEHLCNQDKKPETSPKDFGCGTRKICKDSSRNPFVATPDDKPDDTPDDGHKQTVSKSVARRVNRMCFVIVMSTWFMATVWFFVFTNT